MTTPNRRILKEAAATLEVAIAKCLSQDKLHPSELDEISTLSTADLMIDHELDHLLAEKVITHVRTEKQRHAYQGQLTHKPDSRSSFGSFTRTHPIPEGKASSTSLIKELSDFDLEDITNLDNEGHEDPVADDQGRMLDYGKIKSDSHEGKMMRQALFQISEYGSDLHDLLSDDDDLPQWCHYKVAVARACLSKVKHYLEYKIKKHSGEIQ